MSGKFPILTNRDAMTGEVNTLNMEELPPENKASAQRIANNIKRYWKEFGYEVEAVPYINSRKVYNRTYWGVRSDLVNGLPKDWRGY